MKYRYAKQWGIHCVTAKWFHDSVEAGYSMTEGDYDIDREPGEAGEGDNGTSRKRYVTINHLIRSCIPSYNIIYITCMYIVCSWGGLHVHANGANRIFFPYV